MENNMWWEPREALHIFGEIEREVWTYFANVVGVHGPWIQIKQTVPKWRNALGNEKRNIILHGGFYPVEKIIHGINENIHKFTSFKFPFFLNLPMNRPSIVEVLKSWEQRCRLKIVSWIHPLDGWYKCNVDDASKVVKGLRLPVSTNLFVLEILHTLATQHAVSLDTTSYKPSLARSKHSSSTILFTKTFNYLLQTIYKYLKLYVISKLEIIFVKNNVDDECLILASDGLWDVVSSKMACWVARVCLHGDATFFLLSESATTLHS
ncbi:hypothetical protein H5410_026825 [Solanum commersonii]|uniref:PPM-type phosphatase domain-containing protein n=1 Tax=Solanum commersonii TaxID=4109 RepID=A0A9J5YZM3_SOLCO|nr:hypothetical protein H5410_026825 [Solanum commersonii]